MTTTATAPRLEQELADWLDDARDGLVDDLAELIGIDTATPHEPRAFPLLTDRFERLGALVAEEPRHPDLGGHPAANRNEWSTAPDASRANLRVELPPVGGRARALFSAHIDVVPPGPRFEEAFEARVVDGAVVGRGAADNKGNVVLLLGALRFLEEAGWPRTRDVAVDLVVEEEIGGNGALSAALHGRDVDEAIVLEPTGLEVLHGHRGCLEFTLHVEGRAAHMGGAGLSAIDGALDFVTGLHALERDLLAEARADPAFGSWKRPIQVNVGAIAGGEWHGSVPERCTVRGALGFLPRYGCAAAAELIGGAREAIGDRRLRQRSRLEHAGIHNDAYLGDPEAPVTRELRAAARASGGPRRAPRAWNVSCDARLYHHVLGVPTVIFGAGDLADAHTSAERLRLSQWERGMLAIATFLTRDGPP